MARIADLVANARETVGHIIRFITSGGSANEMPNRQYLDFAGNCTVSDDGMGIRVTVPDVPAGSVTVGNVITLPSGSMAYVNNVGTPVHAILDFGIPRGDPSTDIQPIVFGGTGASTPEGARQNLGVPSIAELQSVSVVAGNSVQLTGNQTVEGLKTFTTSPIVPTATAGDDSSNAASTAYVDAAAGVVSASVAALDNSAVHKTGDETIAGTKTFASSPVVPSPAASDDSTKAATTEWVRDYVEAKLAEIYYWNRNSQV